MQFARKAGKLVVGTDACERAIGRKEVFLLILAQDNSERTKNKMKHIAGAAKNPLRLLTQEPRKK